MSRRVDLPGGGWADIRDIDEITERERRPIVKHLQRVLDSPAGAAMTAVEIARAGDEIPTEIIDRAKTADSDVASDEVNALGDDYILMFVDTWSYGPVDQDHLLDLPAKAYSVLLRETPGFEELLPDFSPSPDDESPTGPSSP